MELVIVNTPENADVIRSVAVARGAKIGEVNDFIGQHDTDCAIYIYENGALYWGNIEYAEKDVKKNPTKYAWISKPAPVVSICGHVVQRNKDGSLQIGCTKVTKEDCRKAAEMLGLL